MNNKYLYALDLLPLGLKNAIDKLKIADIVSIGEIRLRAGGYLTVKRQQGEAFVTYGGNLSMSTANAVRVFKNDIDYTYKRAFENSLYSFEEELKNGYITTKGGNRVGFSSSFIYENGKVTRIHEVTGINIRIAREVLNASKPVFEQIDFKKPRSLIICGPPSSGKTTLLRDIARELGNRYTVVIIDERNEIASASNGEIENDIGRFSDVLSGISKKEGIKRAVRLLSPQIIVCDEIGDTDELKSFEYARNSGVKLIATTHCDLLEDALKKPLVKKMIKQGFFDYALSISYEKKISEIRCLKGEVIKK